MSKATSRSTSRSTSARSAADASRNNVPIVRLSKIGATPTGEHKYRLLVSQKSEKSEHSGRSHTAERAKRSERSDRSVGSYTTYSERSQRSQASERSEKSTHSAGRSDDSHRNVFREKIPCTIRGFPLQRRLHFDFVGGGSDPRTRAELTTLLDHMLSRYQDCCLMHFNNLRRCQKTFLQNLLITEMERRMQLLQSRLLGIQLTYYDINKHENFNVFSAMEKVQHNFRNLQQLQKWLRMDYGQLWSGGRWHEYLQLKFSFLDGKNHEHNTKLDVIQIYMNKMDRNTKWHLTQLLRKGGQLDHVRSGKKNGGYALLTEDLRKYFRGVEPWCTSIIFDISHGSGKVTNSMLQLANAGYEGLKEERRKAEHNLRSSKPPVNNQKITSHALPVGKQSPVEKSSNEVTQKWINEIDAKFADVFSTWREYYDFKQEDKLNRLCQDVRTIAKTAEKAMGDIDEGMERYHAAKIDWHYSNYKSAQKLMRKLLKEIDSYDADDALKPYIHAKTKELEEETARHKVEQLKLCRGRIVSTIRSEIDALQI